MIISNAFSALGMLLHYTDAGTAFNQAVGNRQLLKVLVQMYREPLGLGHRSLALLGNVAAPPFAPCPFHKVGTEPSM